MSVARRPMLLVFGGLPGTGKSTLSRLIAAHFRALYLRIDSIEQALRANGVDVTVEGYAIGYQVAADNLAQGASVVADSVNPLPITRDAWRAVGERADARIVEVEVVCSDAAEHRQRVEQRTTDITGLKLPTWREVVERDYEPWRHSGAQVLQVDTAHSTVESCRQRLLDTITATIAER